MFIFKPPCSENIWAILQRTAQLHEETKQEAKESFKELRQTIQEVAQLQKENERERKENDRKYEWRMKEMNKKLEGISDSQGSFAEEYFFNSFDAGKKDFFGAKFNRIRRNLNSSIVDFVNPSENVADEYDIVMYGDDSVAIIEVKFKAREDNIEQVLRKAETFRKLYSGYDDFKIYLGFAALTFPIHIQQICKKHGIAIIKQIGDTVVINDKHLKVY